MLNIIQALEYKDPDEVTLVGHSYGGLVIGSVAERVPRKNQTYCLS